MINRLGLTLGIGLLALAGLVPSASATVITVNTPLDEFNSGANCSLREAVEAANTNAAFGGCPAGQAGAFDPDFVDVPAGTYTLTQSGVGANNIGDLDVTDTNVTIRNTGPAGQIAVNGASAGDRVIEIAATAFSVAITGIRFTGGSTSGSGGGILNSSPSLVLTNVTVDGSAAGGGGGGISSGAGTTLSASNVTISGNSAGVGDGGGILYNSASNFFVKNSTIVGNDAENGGGIANANGTGVVNVSNTILAGNIGGGEPGDCSGVVNSSGHSLLGTNVGCTYTPHAGGTDLVGADHSEIPANLGPLADNDGTVLTHLPLRTSFALNRGYPDTGPGTTCELIDARGVERPEEDRCDIGAVEVEAPFVTQVYSIGTTTDQYDAGFAFLGACSLREAITAINTQQAFGGCPAGAGGETNTIPLAPGTYTLTRPGVDDTNVNGDLDFLAAGIDIAATGPGQTTIDGNGPVTGDRVIHGLADEGFHGPTGAVITGINIRNGVTSGDGGGVESPGQVILRQVTVSGNSAGDDGGGVHYGPSSAGGVSNSTISGNQATGDGGGLASEPSFFAPVYNDTIVQNTAGGNGGGVVLGGASAANAIVAGNADTSGGNAPDCVGTATLPSLGFNLIGNASGCNFTATTGDQVGTGAAPIAAGLGPLTDNGGTTLTRAPVFGGAALNAGSPATPGGPFPSCLPNDQRGVARPLGGRCDTGSVEFQPVPPQLDPKPNPDPAPVTTKCKKTKKKGKKGAAAAKKCKKKKRK